MKKDAVLRTPQRLAIVRGLIVIFAALPQAHADSAQSPPSAQTTAPDGDENGLSDETAQADAPPADGTRGTDSNGPFRWLSGDKYYDKGGYAQQVEDLTAAIKHEPTRADLYLQRGQALAKATEQAPIDADATDKHARADFDKALALDPGLADAYEARMAATKRLWLTSPDYASAQADADKAVALQPKTAAFYVGRGALLLRALTYEAGILRSKTTAAQEKDAAKRAEADFTQAIALAPQTPGAYTGRAQARVQLQSDPALIETDAVKAVAQDPKDVGAQGILVEAALARGEWALAKAAADAYIALAPTGPAYLARARARFNLKDPDGAVTDATFVVDHDRSPSELCDALVLRGQIYAAQGKTDLAIADYTKATQVYAYSGDAWDLLGMAQAESGKRDAAVATYQAALKSVPYKTVFHLRLALLAAYRNDADTVKTEYAAWLPSASAEDIAQQTAFVQDRLKADPTSIGLKAALTALQAAPSAKPG